MKKLTTLLSIVAILVTMSCHANAQSENFEEFAKKFFTSSEFRIDRIQIPLDVETNDNEFTVDNLDEALDWEFYTIDLLKNTYYINTKVEIEQDGEEIDLSYIGQGGSFNDQQVAVYTFKLLKGKWTLISIGDYRM